ncbi:MAG: hypothetical protein JXP34_02115 [Planctomycetes bacterium]|nr:hypothetical protein [Planctomycetota bacterium]
MNLLAACWLLPLLGSGARADIAPLAPDPLKQLVLDPRVVAETTGLRLAMGEVEKEPRNPLFRADRPWENALNNLYPNVLWDEEERVFKLWYKCVLADKDVIAKMMPPATVHDVGWFLLYATSRDGLAWEKPELGLIGFDGSTRTNIVARDAPNAGVFKDPRDADPARRYKMIYDVGSGKMRVRFSPDGLRWSEPIEPRGFTPYTGDTHNNAFWDQRLGRYVCITRFYLGERLVARAESRDFLSWEDVRLALRSTIAEGRARQLYCMPSFPYANGYIGFLMVYNVGADRTVDCELAWSPDTVAWHRILPGTPLIPRGPAGSPDSACIYGPSGSPVVKDGRLMMFYGGSDEVHRGWKRHCLPCAAYLRPDGFAGYEPVESGGSGTLLTAAVRCTGRPLRVTADAARGSVRVEVAGKARFEIESCEPISGEVTGAPVAWRGGRSLQELAGEEIRLRFRLEAAKLYAFSGVELVPAAPAERRPARPAPAHAPDAAVARRATFDEDAEGWQALSNLEHRSAGGAPGGYIAVSRTESGAFAFAAADGSGGAFCGDLERRFGGAGVAIEAQVRSDRAAAATQIEIFARDIAQWSYDKLPPPGKEWTGVRAALRYDWTDDEARAAGWRPAIQAFSWRETIRNVGRVVVLPAGGSVPSSFDLDSFGMRTLVD